MKTKNIVKVLVGIIIIGGGIGYFMYQAMQSSWSYYYSVDDFSDNKLDKTNHSYRIAGKVKPGSIYRNIEEIKLTFIITGSDNEFTVNYGKTVPDNFTDDIEVVIDGRLDSNGVFQANSLMTKCESKYKAKVK